MDLGKKLAEEHWAWFEPWLEKAFKDGFVHGFKHGTEASKDFPGNNDTESKKGG